MDRRDGQDHSHNGSAVGPGLLQAPAFGFLHLGDVNPVFFPKNLPLASASGNLEYNTNNLQGPQHTVKVQVFIKMQVRKRNRKPCFDLFLFNAA